MMTKDEASAASANFRLDRPIDPSRDHVRGGGVPEVIRVVAYADLLCPYCQRLRHVLVRLREALGDRLVYVFRHFPNERAHPGAERFARATEAAGNQGRFWELHDWIYDRRPPIAEKDLFEFVRSLGLEMTRFRADLESDAARHRVDEDLADGRRNGVTGTPTLFVDGIRYDGAWDFYSMLEALERPVAARLMRSARVFASLPASGGLVLLVGAAAALLCANTRLGPLYQAFIGSLFSLGPSGLLTMTVAEWFSEGLIAIFFLLVGLEIRREITAGALSDRRAATLPVVAAIGGMVAPALIYLIFNRGPTSHGWPIPTATDVAFTLGILALLGQRSPPGLRVFVAALAVVDDVLSVGTLAILSPRGFDLRWLLVSGIATLLLFTLNRWRVYATWPYALIAALLWVALHAAGVHAALAGVILAAFLPTRPAPAVAPLLAQAATALAALEYAERQVRPSSSASPPLAQQPIWDWASRNLSAASDRLLSPADRIEAAAAPWSAYVVLPLFAFSATGVRLALDLSQPGATRILVGVVAGLVIGKPLGVLLAPWLAIRMRIAVAPESVTLRQFIGAALLCGVADTVSLLLVDRAFPGGFDPGVAKIGVLLGSTIAAALGTIVLVTNSVASARSQS
jgi:NhaA family Na+:H+ antiporter